MYNIGMYNGRISNPIVEARFEDGYSLQQLGKRLGLSRQYISRAEQGTYSGLNKELVKYVANVLQISMNEVMRRYETFQVETRTNTATNINPVILSRGSSELEGWKIFSSWRAMYWPSSTSFSNAFCVHPELVRNYEDGALEVIPNPVKSALKSVNLIESDWKENSTPQTAPSRANL